MSGMVHKPVSPPVPVHGHDESDPGVRAARFRQEYPDSMRRFKPGTDDDDGPSPERLREARVLDFALGGMGSKFSDGYAQRLTLLDVALCAFVDGLRGDDIGAAQVLISLKAHLAACATLSNDVDGFAVRRCIARYYEG